MLPNPQSIGIAASKIHAQLGLARSQAQGRWIEKVVKPMPKWPWCTIKLKDVWFDSSSDSCLFRLSIWLNSRMLDLATRQTHDHLSLTCG
jgi:hypothetical protein